MRTLLLGFGTAVMLLAPALSGAAPLRADAAPAAHRPIEDARLVRRCHMARVWRDGPHGRHLVHRRVCHMVRVR